MGGNNVKINDVTNRIPFLVTGNLTNSFYNVKITLKVSLKLSLKCDPLL